MNIIEEQKNTEVSSENNEISQNIFNQIINLNKSDNEQIKSLIDSFMAVEAHYGHRKEIWNPSVSKYLFAEHDGVHIIDLTKTIFLLKNVLNYLIKLFSENNARILFVASKEQLSEVIEFHAKRCGQSSVTNRWFGGTLTNWETIKKSIRKMGVIEREIYENKDKMNKKQIASKERILSKLNKSLGGIKKMSNIPDVLFVTDTRKEKVAIAEANKLNIPVIALLDSNSNPKGIDYPIPCNDDNQRAVELIASLISDAVLVGMEVSFEKREAANKQRNQNQKRKSFVRSKRDGALESESDNSVIDNTNLEQEKQDEKSNESIKTNVETKAKQAVSSGFSNNTLKKSFIKTSQSKNKISSGGFSSASGLLKQQNQNPSIVQKNNNKSSLNKTDNEKIDNKDK